MNLWQILFFVVDFALFVIGIIVVSVGIWILSDERIGHYETDEMFTATNIMYKSAYIVIVFGLTMLILGLLGCFALFIKNMVLLFCFVATVVIIPLSLFIAAIVIAWYAAGSHKIQRLLYDELKQIWMKHKIFRTIESNLKCCGIQGQEDYGPHASSMCRTDNKTLQYGNITDEYSYYKTGCAQQFQEVLKSMAAVISGLSTTLLILTGIAIILALFLRRNEATKSQAA